MAFTLRTEGRHDETLDRLCRKLEINSKAKVVLWLIENYEECDEHRMDLYDELLQVRKELNELKRNVAEAEKLKEMKDNHLKEIIAETKRLNAQREHLLSEVHALI